MTLYDLQNNNKCIIKKMPLINLLYSLGLREGLSISITTRQPLGGPIVVQMGNRNIAIAKDIAKKIQVKELI